MKKLILFLFFLTLVPFFASAQKQKKGGTTPPVADTTQAKVTYTGSEETLRFSESNLDTLGFGPQNYRNLHVRLSAPLKGKRVDSKVYVDDQGRIVKKKLQDLEVSSEHRGLITNWTPAGAPGWMDDRIQVSFSLKGGDAPYCILLFKVCEWGGDETTKILVDSKEPDESLFYLKTAGGTYAFQSSSAEICLLVDIVTEDADEPYQSEPRKPSESTGGKETNNKWSNRGMTVGDL